MWPGETLIGRENAHPAKQDPPGQPASGHDPTGQSIWLNETVANLTSLVSGLRAFPDVR